MSRSTNDVAPTILVVFGATGDLMARKVVPSLYHLRSKGSLPERLCVVGFGRREWGDHELQEHVRAILDERVEGATESDIESFVGLFRYQQGGFPDTESFSVTKARIDSIQDEWGVCANKLFYLAVPPVHYETIFRNLAASGLTAECSDLFGWTRVLVEKPFGDDQRSARELDTLLGSLFREEQIYRIDHYLAKEMLQGILNFRFANNLFEGEWGRAAIERIDISLLEQIGAEKRGAFYDSVGALRDVGQNHLLQMLSLVTMDRPASAAPDDIREARARLIESMAPLSLAQVARDTFRAQHDGYTQIVGVAPDSQTETYFRMHTKLSGPRWAGVSVMMESGKRMGPALKRITVTFKHPHPCLCPGDEHPVNKVLFNLEPSDGIEIVFYTKKPGFETQLEPRSFTFQLFERTEKVQYVEEYAKLLYDAFRGDQTLFVSTREIDAGWRLIDPVTDAWSEGAVPLERYAPDSAQITHQAEAAIAASETKGRVAVAGLGKMGAGLARNLMDHGWEVAGWNRTHSVAESMASEGLLPVESLTRLVSELAPPRIIWLMVPAGAPVDALLFGSGDAPGLSQMLAPGDIVIDGGNSLFSDAPERARKLAENGIRFLDCGTSGGPHGARTGATLMIGGTEGAFRAAEPMFADAATADGYRFFPGHGAGHFVKMVHNGIEYGMMQAIAEGFEVMYESAFDLDLEQVADLYQHRSVIESRLVGWLKDAYAQHGDDLEDVSGVVGHSGEGEWTVLTANDMGIPVPVIDASFKARIESERSPRYAGRVLTALRDGFGGHGLGPGGGPRR